MLATTRGIGYASAHGLRRCVAVCVAVLACAVAAGCSSPPAPPSEQELEAVTLPSPDPLPYATNTPDACGLLTDAEIRQETGAAVDRSGVVAGGCVWQASSSGGIEPLVDLRVVEDRDGDIDRVYSSILATEKEQGDVRTVDGIGERGFAAESAAPTVWWVQAGRVYGLSILVPQAPGAVDRSVAALDLARLASSRIER